MIDFHVVQTPRTKSVLEIGHFEQIWMCSVIEHDFPKNEQTKIVGSVNYLAENHTL